MAQSPLTTSPAKQVIVVGSGLAGLSAASQLIAHNVPVHMLERSAKPGGNSIKASSGINGAPTKYQPIPDSKFYDDTVKSAGLAFTSADTTLQRQKLVLTLTESSSNAVNWLIDEKGIDLRTVAQLGGHSLPRTHRGSGQLPPGAAIVTKLSSDLKASPLYQLSTSSIVTKVLKTGDEVTGVEYTSEGEVKTLNGPVIFASGGFGGDAKGLLAKYRPDLANLPSTNEPRPGSQDLLTSVGAQLLDMELVQVHPTSFVDPKDTSNPLKFLAAELLRGEGGLLLREGKRFVDELQTRSFITDVIMNGPADEIYETGLRLWDVFVVLDEGCYAAAKSHIDFYLWKGLMVKTTISKLKHAEEALRSIQEFADVATSRGGGEKKDRFGRSAFANWKLRDVEPESVIYVGRVTPAIHFTMGGVVFNEKAQVLDSQGNHIRGLWAAGEVTGGVHGDNRLGGSSLLECVVFGRVAGDQAAGAFEAVKA